MWDSLERPRFFKYEKTNPKFETLIPSEFSHQVRGALTNGKLIRICKLDSMKNNTETISIFDDIDSAFKTLFIQQCQFISPNNKLLSYIHSWLQKIPYRKFQQLEFSCTENVRNSCCFKHVVLFDSQLSKLGILSHFCTFTKFKTFDRVLAKTIAKWYGDDETCSAFFNETINVVHY